MIENPYSYRSAPINVTTPSTSKSKPSRGCMRWVIIVSILVVGIVTFIMHNRHNSSSIASSEGFLRRGRDPKIAITPTVVSNTKDYESPHHKISISQRKVIEQSNTELPSSENTENSLHTGAFNAPDYATSSATLSNTLIENRLSSSSKKIDALTIQPSKGYLEPDTTVEKKPIVLKIDSTNNVVMVLSKNKVILWEADTGLSKLPSGQLYSWASIDSAAVDQARLLLASDGGVFDLLRSSFDLSGDPATTTVRAVQRLANGHTAVIYPQHFSAPHLQISHAATFFFVLQVNSMQVDTSQPVCFFGHESFGKFCIHLGQAAMTVSGFSFLLPDSQGDITAFKSEFFVLAYRISALQLEIAVGGGPFLKVPVLVAEELLAQAEPGLEFLCDDPDKCSNFGTIAEVLIYGTAVDDTMALTAFDYFKTKYNLLDRMAYVPAVESESVVDLPTGSADPAATAAEEGAGAGVAVTESHTESLLAAARVGGSSAITTGAEDGGGGAVVSVPVGEIVPAIQSPVAVEVGGGAGAAAVRVTASVSQVSGVDPALTAALAEAAAVARGEIIPAHDQAEQAGEGGGQPVALAAAAVVVVGAGSAASPRVGGSETRLLDREQAIAEEEVARANQLAAREQAQAAGLALKQVAAQAQRLAEEAALAEAEQGGVNTESSHPSPDNIAAVAADPGTVTGIETGIGAAAIKDGAAVSVPLIPLVTLVAAPGDTSAVVPEATVLGGIVTGTIDPASALNEANAVKILDPTTTGFDIPKNDKPAGSVGASSREGRDVVSAKGASESNRSGIVGMKCSEGQDPFVGLQVDAYLPPALATVKEKAQWEDAVKDMLRRMSLLNVGGAKLREIIEAEVAKLKKLREELFCTYF